jgi:hypothetical protein
MGRAVAGVFKRIFSALKAGDGECFNQTNEELSKSWF